MRDKTTGSNPVVLVFPQSPHCFPLVLFIALWQYVAMVCVYCSNPLDVINSRRQHRNNQVWRRRRCPQCGGVFTTTEAIDLTKSIVVRDKDGKLSPFIKERLLLSIYKSCQHRRTALNDAIALTDTVTRQILEHTTDGSISRGHIAAVCQSVLQNFDKAAVVQYEAYHAETLA
jgi:transcriptional repressor NrdR